MRSNQNVTGAWVMLGCAMAAIAAEPESRAALIARAKHATAMVESSGGKGPLASAFCFDPTGLFVTARHAVSGAGKVRLVLDAGEKEQRTAEASLLCSDEASDLAVLKIDQPKNLAALDLGGGELLETQEVLILGHSSASGTAAAPDDYPAITVSLSRIASLQKVAGRLARIHVDAKLAAECSGGPVLDQSGRVIGVVRMGTGGPATTAFAVPVSSLVRLLQKPQITFTPQIPAAKQREPYQFQIKLARLRPGTSKRDVQLELTSGDNLVRRFTARPAENDPDTYTVSAIPVPPPGPSELIVTLEFSRGALFGRAKERTVHVGDTEIQLSQIKSISNRDGKATLLIAHPQRPDTEESVLSLPELEALPISVGELELTVNVLLARRASVKEKPPVALPPAYRVLVREGQEVVAETAGGLPLIHDGPPSQPALPEIRPREPGQSHPGR